MNADLVDRPVLIGVPPKALWGIYQAFVAVRRMAIAPCILDVPHPVNFQIDPRLQPPLRKAWLKKAKVA